MKPIDLRLRDKVAVILPQCDRAALVVDRLLEHRLHADDVRLAGHLGRLRPVDGRDVNLRVDLRQQLVPFVTRSLKSTYSLMIGPETNDPIEHGQHGLHLARGVDHRRDRAADDLGFAIGDLVALFEITGRGLRSRPAGDAQDDGDDNQPSEQFHGMRLDRGMKHRRRTTAQPPVHTGPIVPCRELQFLLDRNSSRRTAKSPRSPRHSGAQRLASPEPSVRMNSAAATSAILRYA